MGEGQERRAASPGTAEGGTTIPARELVEGDVVHLKLGDLIPADCALLQNLTGNAPPIQVDQSSLNGESLPKTM